MFDYTANPLYNPYLTQQYAQQPQRQEVPKVNGEPGARAYPLGPNSSALLLDVSGTIVWLVTTDSAGYKTVAPFDISPHQEAPPPDFGSLETRIARLEERINGYTHNPANAQRSECTTPHPDKADDRRDKERR